MPNTPTNKLGAILPQENTPGGQPSPFKMPKRMPGWNPDATAGNDGKRVEVFIEEAIFENQLKGFEPFPVPQSDGVPFKEPPRNAKPEEWLKYHQWIYGTKIPKRYENEAPLTTLLRKLAVHARRYNASLYRLRRLHYYLYVTKTNRHPVKNPYGDPKQPLPPPESKEFGAIVAAAEKDWAKVTCAIEKFINRVHTGLDNLRIVAADMVEVNGYVVSMRVVAKKNGHSGDMKFGSLEVGGSSSHFLLSSPFSSYVSSSSP